MSMKNFEILSKNFNRNAKRICINAGLWALIFVLPTVLLYLGGIEVTQSRSWSTGNASLMRQQSCNLNASVKSTCGGEVPSGCTVFTVSKGDQVFFGGNDDYINPDSYYWVDPGDSHDYGAIWIGTTDDVQQGVNEKGLAYDANGLPRVDTNPHPEREPVSGGYTSYPIRILHECATVEEVITWVSTHQWHSYMHDQMQFADASGDAVIISAGADGELVFTRKPHGDGYLVSTNFNVANPANGYGYPCWRYETATKMLSKLVNREGDLTYHDATNVLDAVHVSGGTSWTIKSLVADLPNGIVYLYYFHQFDRPLMLNVAEEIANPRSEGPLSKLFPEDVKQDASLRYQRIQAQENRCQLLGKIWLGLVLASLAALLILSIKKLQGRVFWMPVVVILGPLGLVVWLIAGRKPGTGWRTSLVEAVGDATPPVIAFMIYLTIVILVMEGQASQVLQFLLILVLPVLIALLVFQGELLTPVIHKGYLRTLGQRLPQAWVTANLGMAGINVLAAPLVNASLRTCAIFPVPSPWNVAGWWAFTAIGALVAILLLTLYEGWAVRRGFRAWSILAFKDGEVTTPSWRKLWWWILLSYVALFMGLVAGVLLQQVSLR